MPGHQPPHSSANRPGVFGTDLALPDHRVGKVRDTYRLPATGGAGEADRLLIIATDRLSAFDVVLPTSIPGKGVLLTRIAAFWLRFIAERGLWATHLISTDAGAVPGGAFGAGTRREDLAGRVTIGRRCRVIPVEFVVRGYLEGSGWKDYQRTGSVCGTPLPAGLVRCDRLPEPILTPATKAEQGEHDENISFERAGEIAGRETMGALRAASLAIYRAASEYALARGIIIADTKFEFGVPIDNEGRDLGEGPILIDEALTPDSSRFWPADLYEPGRAQPSFDKQYVREHLEALVARGAWGKSAPGPVLPPGVIAGTLERYEDVGRRLLA